MNIFTKIFNTDEENNWQSNKCTHIKFDESPVLKPNEDCYYALKFKYKFDEQCESVLFAYAMPYGYKEL